jgi:uncharacterized damage-inducible protein DinB
MTAEELKKLIAEAEQDPKRLAAAVAGVPEATLRRKPAPDKWCIHEIVGHLADAEVIFAYRFRQVLADKDPKFAPIDQDAWAANLGYTEAAIPELIAQFGVNRFHNVRILRREGLEACSKSGFHPERNRQVTLEEMLQYWVGHGPNHLAQIERLKKAPTQ